MLHVYVFFSLVHHSTGFKSTLSRDSFHRIVIWFPLVSVKQQKRKAEKSVELTKMKKLKMNMRYFIQLRQSPSMAEPLAETSPCPCGHTNTSNCQSVQNTETSTIASFKKNIQMEQSRCTFNSINLRCSFINPKGLLVPNICSVYKADKKNNTNIIN